MPPTFTSSTGLLETAIAKQALTQLNTAAMYSQVCVMNYEPGAFQRGNSVKIRRPKRRKATDLNPRSAGLQFTEAEFFAGEVLLERLWADQYLYYGYDASQAVDLYLEETASQIADAIAVPKDEYMYNKFRDWSPFASSLASGAYALGDTPPFAIAACLDSGGNLVDFNNEGLRGAGVFLEKEDVGDDDNYVLLSPFAKNSFLGDAIALEGARLEAQRDPTASLVVRGIRRNQFVQRYKFMVGGSNSVLGQAAVADLDTVASNQGVLPVASVADNTQFTYADFSSTYNVSSGQRIGALDITLTAGTALAAGVAVGKICKLALVSSPTKTTTFFGVILRINATAPAAPIVTLVPYAFNGRKASASEITTSHQFSIPEIPSVNTVNNREGLLCANRMIRDPRPGSGAVAASLRDPVTNQTIQVFSGQYDLGTVSEKNAAYQLMGCRISDCRKTGLILSN